MGGGEREEEEEQVREGGAEEEVEEEGDLAGEGHVARLGAGEGDIVPKL